MRIPSQRECFQLISEMDMLDNIVAHSIQVCRVATVLLDLLEIQCIADAIGQVIEENNKRLLEELASDLPRGE